jgi:hypothetical protein
MLEPDIIARIRHIFLHPRPTSASLRRQPS